MISFITKALGFKNLATYAIVAVLALALADGAYWYVDHRGYERAAVIYQARIDAERAAQCRG